MKLRNLNKSHIQAWSDAEREFLGSLPLSRISEERYEAAKDLIAQVYPDLRGGKWHSNFLFNTSLVTQIPFTSHMIVDVRPYTSPSEFERFYGVSIEEFTHLVREGFLYPNFGSDMHRYTGRSFLLPIFNACTLPPSNLRTDKVFSLLDSEYEERCHRLSIDLRPYLDRYWSGASEELHAYYMLDIDAFRTTWSKRIARIWAISPVWGRILSRYSRRRDFLTLANIFTSIFVFPITKSLGGVYKMSYQNYRALCSAMGVAQVKGKRIMSFSKDIAEPICDAIAACLPQQMDVKRLSRYLDDDLVQRANELMQEIESQIAKRESSDASTVNTLHGLWREMVKMININEKRRTSIQRVLNIALAGLVGATLWSKIDFTAVLYGVVAREVLKKDVDTFTDAVAKEVVTIMSRHFQPAQVWMFSDYLEEVKGVVPKVYLS